MTKRTYVKPEWHAMGMPIAAAACQRGFEDVGTMGYCQPGGIAAGACNGGSGVFGTACTDGGAVTDPGGAFYCYTGGSPKDVSNNCTTGGVAVG